MYTCVLAITCFDHSSQTLVEIVGCEKLFEREMHAITPVVTWVGWDVDSLSVGIRKTKVSIDRKPVLHWEDAEEGRRCEMV